MRLSLIFLHIWNEKVDGDECPLLQEELVDVDLLKESSDAELLADLLVLTPKVLSQEFPILHQVGHVESV